MDQEIVKDPHIFDKTKKNDEPIESDEVKLICKPPRLFRKSIIYKTLKLCGWSHETDVKVSRPLKEK